MNPTLRLVSKADYPPIGATPHSYPAGTVVCERLSLDTLIRGLPTFLKVDVAVEALVPEDVLAGIKSEPLRDLEAAISR